MREKEQIQKNLFMPAVCEIEIPEKSRYKLYPVMRALQEIYKSYPEITELVIKDLNKDSGKKKCNQGRNGLTGWQVLCLQTIRRCLNNSYDDLADMVKHHTLIRQLLEINDDETAPKRSCIQENLSKLKPETLEKINEVKKTR